MLSVVGSPAYAQITNPAVGSLGDNPTEASSGTTFINYFIYLWNAVMVVGGLIVLLFFIQALEQLFSPFSEYFFVEKSIWIFLVLFQKLILNIDTVEFMSMIFKVLFELCL